MLKGEMLGDFIGISSVKVSLELTKDADLDFQQNRIGPSPVCENSMLLSSRPLKRVGESHHSGVKINVHNQYNSHWTIAPTLLPKIREAALQTQLC